MICLMFDVLKIEFIVFNLCAYNIMQIERFID